MFKDDIEKVVQENVGKEQHFSYQQKVALIQDLYTALGENLDKKHKSILEELDKTYDELIALSDGFVFSYTYDYVNRAWREMVLNCSEECLRVV